MKTIVDTGTWARRPHFEFFKGFDDPFFSLTATVDCAALLKRAKACNHSVFLSYLHAALRAINAIEAFRLRLEGDQVILYDKIDIFSTAARPDGTFGFSFIEYIQDFTTFATQAAASLEATRQANDLRPDSSRHDVVHGTVIPWLHFTGVTHPKHYGYPDSIPKLSFGKIIEDGEKRPMPVSVQAHHALMDARHVAEFFELLQSLMDEG